MNKQHFKNYFRGYNNKYKEQLYKDPDDHNYYCTNLISIVKLYSSYGLDYIEGDSRLKDYVNMFDQYEEYGYIDKYGHIFERNRKPNLDFACDIRKLEKISNLVYQNTDPIVLKRKDRDQFVIKVEGECGYGYLLPVRNY